MGRYITGDLDFKFWFGIQATEDILEYGVEEELDYIPVVVEFSKLKEIKEKVKRFKKEFRESFKMSYKMFRKKLDKKGCLESSDDKETHTKKWRKMLEKASKISLGEKVLKALKEKGDDLYLQAEY